ncbi:DNA polymerase III subunit beta [Bacteroides gallinaceum]|uniref:Beta sliding clamp n=2 Tax=Bacteroidaceae TaxID=815 RepID=A0ABT7X529_9BACE|nr:MULTISPECIES: DNA polymerase III subunit beta [Bacteroidaceae]CCZ69843.1 dNA polymerase III subunit beta [Bacteroides sp. CAG:702]HJD10330.1 DNA polymerase III subunit beta [Candidatus Phocaeicola caecigallinarum]MBD8041901.1 DNA polymerase III subunit beta [Phocaeicola intestinalis]MBM6657588.1 DNA polymerase III subunit beta [Bacteroides gallinaceum]MBM6719202.1 DNA polymerase III subunit beta [Bacteroides gallinaceum]
MKFIVSSTSLFSHLQAISRVINSKNSLPILDCFLLELHDGTLSMTASDNETTLSTSIEVNEFDGDGRFAVSSRTLLEALKEIPEQPLSFAINPENLEITVQYQNGKYSLMGQNADEYPKPQALGNNAVQLTIPANVLLDGVNRCIFATADDELRPVMNGIYFDITSEDITLVASDGHKLVRNKTYEAHGSEKAAFILPKKPANLLKNLLTKEQGDVQIGFDDRNATFILENYQMVCRLIEGRYPNYNSVIPQNNPHKAVIDRSSLISALRRVSVFSSQASSLIKLNLSTNQMKISAQDIDFSTSAEETLMCQYEGNDMSIGFKSSFLIDILNNIPSTNVVIELADPSRAGVIVPEEQSENEDLLMLLMPMMLND